MHLEQFRPLACVLALLTVLPALPAGAAEPLTQDTNGLSTTVPVYRPSAPPPGNPLAIPDGGVEVPDGTVPDQTRRGTIFDACRTQLGIGDTNRPIYCKGIQRR